MSFEHLYVAFLALVAIGAVVATVVVGVDDIEKRANERLVARIIRGEDE